MISNWSPYITTKFLVAVFVVSLMGVISHWMSSFHVILDISQGDSEQKEFLYFKRSQAGIINPKFVFGFTNASSASLIETDNEHVSIVAENGSEIIPIKHRNTVKNKVKRMKRRVDLVSATDNNTEEISRLSDDTTDFQDKLDLGRSKSSGKRVSSKNKKGLLNWNFNLNLSRSVPMKTSRYHPGENGQRSLSAAVQVEGKNDTRVGEYLLHSWNVVGKFLKELLITKSDAVEGIKKGDISVVDGSNSKLISFNLTSQEQNIERNRTGRILGWFGFGGGSDQSTIATVDNSSVQIQTFESLETNSANRTLATNQSEVRLRDDTEFLFNCSSSFCNSTEISDLSVDFDGSGDALLEIATDRNENTEMDESLANICFQQMLSKTKTSKFTDDVTNSQPEEKLSIENNLNLTSTSGIDEENSTELKLETQTELELNSTESNSNKLKETFLVRKTRFVGIPSIFDFFGSGSGPRMVDENLEAKISFDSDRFRNYSREINGTETPNCTAFFQNLLDNQDTITKPNLMDILMLLKSKNDSRNKTAIEKEHFASPFQSEANREVVDILDGNISNRTLESQNRPNISFDGINDFIWNSTSKNPRSFLGVFGSGDSRLFNSMFGSGDFQDENRNDLWGSGEEPDKERDDFLRSCNFTAEARWFLGRITGSGGGPLTTFDLNKTCLEIEQSLTEYVFSPMTDLGLSVDSNLRSRSRGSRRNDDEKEWNILFDHSKEIEKNEITFKSSTYTSNLVTVEPRSKYCKNSGECSESLNEECVPENEYLICGCSRSFIRHPSTSKCERKVMLETSLRFPNENYDVKLEDKTSDLYWSKKKAAEETMWILLRDDKELAKSIAVLNVTGFSRGSLVIHWMIVYANAHDESPSELGDHLDYSLKQSLNQTIILQQLPLIANQATLNSVSKALNPCSRQDLNNCGQNAACSPYDNRPGGFFCRCQQGYVDISDDREFYPGRECKAVCPLDFCGDYGVCRSNFDGTMECLCSGWHFGENCQISGVVIVACGVAANIVIAVSLICCLWCIHNRRKQSAYGNPHNHFLRSCDYDSGTNRNNIPTNLLHVAASSTDTVMPARFSRTKVSPFMSPQPSIPPEINVIPPSYSEYSYCVDSTFNTTPSPGSNHRSIYPSITS